MKKSFILFAALAALFSCTKENAVSPETPSQETYSVTLTAVAPTAGDDTKTTLVEGGKFVHWSKGDAIKVMFFIDAPNNTVGFESPGQIFTSYFDEETSSEANFRIPSWSYPAETQASWFKDKGIAVYPSSATAYSNMKKTDNMYSLEVVESKVSFTLPESQNAVIGNIESNLNFSYAEVDHDSFRRTLYDNAETKLQFKNACALVKLTMPQTFGEKTVKSIMVTSSDDKPLTGYAYLKLDNTSNRSTQNIVSDPFTMLVSGDAGVTLTSETGFEPGQSYYAVVWPGEHTALKFTFVAEDESTAVVTTKSAVSLQASHVKPYKFNELSFVAKAQDRYPEDGGEYKYYYSDGSVGDDPKPLGKVVLGVVFYLGNPRELDPALPAHCTHGLALSLNFTGGVRFHAKTSVSGWPSNTGLHGLGTLYGYSAMTAWKDAGEYASMTLYNTNYGDIDASKTSGWYHATDKEWDIIASNMGALNASLEECGAAKIPESDVNCWVPILGSTLKRGMYVSSCKSTGVSYDSYLVSNKLNARPIFAF